MPSSNRNSQGRAAVVTALVLALVITAGLLFMLFGDMFGALRAVFPPAAQTPPPAATPAADVPRDVAVAPAPATEEKAPDAAAAPAEAAPPHVRVFGSVADEQGAPCAAVCVRWVPLEEAKLRRWSHDGAVLGMTSDAARVGDATVREALGKSLATAAADDGAYELKIPEGASLGVVVATGAGYETQFRPVDAHATLPGIGAVPTMPVEAPAPAAETPAPVAAEPAGDAPARSEGAAANESRAPREFQVDFRLKAACSIAGTVLERETRAPAEGMFVVAGVVDREKPAIFDFLNEEMASAAVGRDGTYVLQGLPLGEWRVLPRTGESEYAPVQSKAAQQVTLQKGIDITGVDFTVSRGGIIHGIVSGPDGKPVAGVNLRLIPGNIMTAAVGGDMETLVSLDRGSRPSGPDGAYEFRGLPLDKEYRVAATCAHLAGGTSDIVKLSAEEPQARIDLALAAGSTIAGVVVHNDGTPAPKTNVMIIPDMSDLGRSMAGTSTTITDDAGAFKLEHVLPGEVKLSAGPISTDVILSGKDAVTVVLDGTNDVTDVRIVIDNASSSALAGVVTDSSGAPLEGAQVSAASKGNMMAVVQAVSNSGVSSGPDGKFAFTELKGEVFKLTARKEGYSPASVDGVAAGTRDVVLRLAKHGRISGRVVTAAGEAPGAGGKVLARPIVAESLMESVQRIQAEAMAMGRSQDGGAQVREDGTFSVEAPAGNVEVRATIPGFAPARSGEIVVSPGQEYGGVKIVVTAGAIVRGRVTLGDDAPVEGATVQVQSKEGNEASAMLRQLMPQFFGNATPTSPSNADGLFAVEHLAEGEYTVSATHPKFAPSEPVTVTLGRDQVCDTVRLVLQRGGALAGKVMEQDKPKSGMLVQLVGGKAGMKQAMTDATGEFWFGNLPAGEYVVNILDIAAMQKGAMSVKNRVVKVENERTSELTVAIGGGRKVFGKVKGYPAAPMRVLTLRIPGGPNPEDQKTVDMQATMENAKFQVGVGILTQDDKYEIADIEPGTYILEAPRMPDDPTDFESYAKMENRTPFYRKEITIKDEDLELDIEIK